MNASLEELARVLGSQGASAATTAWSEHVLAQIPHWSTQATRPVLPPSGDAPFRPRTMDQLGERMIPPTSDTIVGLLPQVTGTMQASPFVAHLSGPIDYFQASMESAASELQSLRADARDRSKQAFALAIIYASAGAIAIFVGIGLWMAGLVAGGLPSGAAGVISSVASKLIFNFYQRESAAISNFALDLRRIEETRLGLWVVSRISETEARDKAIAALAATITKARPGPRKQRESSPGESHP